MLEQSSQGKVWIRDELKIGTTDTSTVSLGYLKKYRNDNTAIKNENVLFLSNNTWAYLATDMRYGTYSAWTQGGGLETAVSRLNQYYTLNPDKIPKYVYIPKADNPNLNVITSAFWGKDYKLTASKIAYILSK